MAILVVEELVKAYQRRRVVDGISMEVHAGEIVGLLGPNGAGKSTCFKMICGLVRPDRGTVWLLENNVTKLPLFQRSRLGMGYLPQQSSLFAKLSVQANLIGMMQLLGFSGRQQKERCAELLDQFNIAHVRKSKAETLSGGERRRLEIARCLVSNPRIIMLDEPFAAIDPVTVQNIQSVIRELADSGIAILITDHAAREILQITDRTYVVSDGRILCSGSAEEIINHEVVRQKYLGDLDFSHIIERKAVERNAGKPNIASRNTVEPPAGPAPHFATRSQANSNSNARTEANASELDGHHETTPLQLQHRSAPSRDPKAAPHSNQGTQSQTEQPLPTSHDSAGSAKGNQASMANLPPQRREVEQSTEQPADHRPKIVFSTDRKASPTKRKTSRTDLD